MNNHKPPAVQVPRVGPMFGGMAVVAAGLAAWCYGLLRYQSRKDERGEYSTWEYSLLQAQSPVDKLNTPSTTVHSRASKCPGNASSAPDPPNPGMLATHPDGGGAASLQARADSAVPDAPQTKTRRATDRNVGPRAGSEPTPQRTRTRDDDDRLYTKARRYVDDYDEHKKH